MQNSSLIRIVTGLVIAIIGAGFLLHNLGAVDLSEGVSTYWPLFVILGGLLLFANNPRNWLLPVFVVLLGGLYQLRELDIISFQPWQVVWPLIVVAVGVSLLFRRSYVTNTTSKKERDDVFALMGGSEIANTAREFKGSSITAIMGGARIDLRKTNFANDTAIEVFSFWGGVEIIVPENVQILNKVNCIMAGCEDKTTQKVDKKSPRLIIAGDLIMAGLEIRNRPSND
ncbi:MAG TPA: DUF5668 domain-containing protein [Candidatus Saccharimonadales bacterium]